MAVTIRNILRLNKIVTTLVRYGFGGLVSELRIFPVFSFFRRIFTSGAGKKELSVAVRIRLVLEELGPTFIKLGQVASTRGDLLPPEWLEGLQKLQEAVPPFSLKQGTK